MIEQTAPISAKAQTPKKYFQIKVTYTETKVIANIDKKVPPNPY